MTSCSSTPFSSSPKSPEADSSWPAAPGSLRAVAARWLAAEPDEDVRAELRGLLDGPDGLLEGRFDGMLEFGTAGLRAEIGAGPLRMNRLVVRQAAAGFADYLLDTHPTAASCGVLIGWDGRRKSDVFALDTARVLAARGVRALLFPCAAPTPVLAWNVTRLGVAGAVMVTASHNPALDNGFKVFLGSGGQIVPPVDVEIARRMACLDPCDVTLAPADDALIGRLPREVIQAYVEWAPSVLLERDVTPVRVAYSALCGVGGRVLLDVFAAAGFPVPAVVASQQEPDGSFPGLPFPNPEEPGVLDEVIALAEREGLTLALVNDPDGDRLGVATRSRAGRWRRWSGDEIGWVLAEHVLERTSGSDRLVATTVVSSSLLGRIAAAHGVHFEETFTGFKWLADLALRRSDLRLVLAYEQALGFLVASRPLDKDGCTAALLLVEAASVAASRGLTLDDRLEELSVRYGRVCTAERSIRMGGSEAAAVVTMLMSSEAPLVEGFSVERREHLPAAGLVRLFYASPSARLRLSVRPSGTEPKVKFYGELASVEGQADVLSPERMAEVLGGALDGFVAACAGVSFGSGPAAS